MRCPVPDGNPKKLKAARCLPAPTLRYQWRMLFAEELSGE
jgi:hypothetical protein